MQEAVHRAANQPDGWSVAGLVESDDLELIARNSRWLGIKFPIRTKLAGQIEEYSTSRDAPVGRKRGSRVVIGDCLCRCSTAPSSRVVGYVCVGVALCTSS